MAIDPAAWTSLADLDSFSAALYQRMAGCFPGIAELELYEFRYLLANIAPPEGWSAVQTESTFLLESRICSRGFFEAVQTSPQRSGQIVLDETIAGLARMLMAGLVRGDYKPGWVLEHFYFDIRSCAFFVRTQYFTPQIASRFGGKPWRSFKPTQVHLESQPDLGYPEFQAANREVDAAFLEALQRLVAAKGTPVLVTLVGPTAAGKTEIAARLQERMLQAGLGCASVEFDNFLRDRSFRDGRPMGIEVIHFELFKTFAAELLHGRTASMPRYDFIRATSSHGQDGQLRPGQSMITIQPSGIILLEGNFPFHIPEIAPLVGIKAVYLTDDPIRLKRKWRRDVDYRKKYDPMYLSNRFFRTQHLRAEDIYRPMLAVCDLAVDTTGAALWAPPEIALKLG